MDMEDFEFSIRLGNFQCKCRDSRRAAGAHCAPAAPGTARNRAGFNDRVESFEVVSRFNLVSTTNIYIEVRNNYSSRGPILIISQLGTESMGGGEE